MEIIKRKNVNKEIKKLEVLLKDYNNMTQEARNILIKRGYVKETLGTGDSAHILSGMIVQKNIKSRFFLNGEYLVIGISSKKRGNGIYYRGYVKEIL